MRHVTIAAMQRIRRPATLGRGDQPMLRSWSCCRLSVARAFLYSLRVTSLTESNTRCCVPSARHGPSTFRSKIGNLAVADSQETSFVVRNEFLIRRLHSLTGLIPVGAYLVVHLLTNASILDGAQAFQRAVFMIHSLNSALWVVEWVFIFLPLIFHAVIGFWIIAGGVPNTQSYPYKTNFGYTLQRATGMIAAVFILWHVFQMHGWFHNQFWLDNVATPLGGHVFRPYNAASTLGMVMQGTGAILFIILYAIGVLACVYHLAYGLWTMGITWGVWITPAAQARAGKVCTAFGIGLALVGVSAIYGAATVDVEEARKAEERMYEYGVASGNVKADEHKRYHPAHADEQAAVTETPATTSGTPESTETPPSIEVDETPATEATPEETAPTEDEAPAADSDAEAETEAETE